MDYRPLEGFVTAITPFNFTAIAGNLPTVPALMGNTVVWKPSPTQQVAAHHTMRLLEAAGLPAGVINMVTGDGLAVSRGRPRPTRDLAGLHFTGSSGDLPDPVADGRARTSTGYRSYPRLVGETGGKDFVVAHPSADPAPPDHRARPRRLRVPGSEVLGRLPGVRAAAASGRAGYATSSADVTRSTALRRRHRPDDTSAAPSSTRRAFDRPPARAGPGASRRRHWRSSPAAAPTTARAASSTRPSLSRHRPGRRGVHHASTSARSSPCTSTTTAEYAATLDLVDRTSAVRADRGRLRRRTAAAVERADRALRHAAGNFYVNDQPTGAIVAQPALRRRPGVAARTTRPARC